MTETIDLDVLIFHSHISHRFDKSPHQSDFTLTFLHVKWVRSIICIFTASTFVRIGKDTPCLQTPIVILKWFACQQCAGKVLTTLQTTQALNIGALQTLETQPSVLLPHIMHLQCAG